MEKNNLFKVLGISFLIMIVLSWIIPLGTFSNGSYIQGKTYPLGILDIIRIPLSSIANFIHYAIYFLIIGGFYGVLNKTGAYAKIVNSLVEKFKEKENKFLIISILTFALLSSFFGNNLILFVLVPFFITVILSLNYNKMVAFLATFGALLVGMMGSTYGFNISVYINNYFSLNMNSDIISKVIVLAIFVYMLIVFTLKIAKKNSEGKSKNKEKKEIVLFENNENKERSILPIIVMAFILMITLIIGVYDFQFVFNFDKFEEFYNSVIGYEINGFNIVSSIIGSIGLVGSWNIYEISMVLILFTGLIAWIYGIKFKDTVDAFIKGSKEVLPVAVCILFVFLLYSLITTPLNGQTMFNTVMNFLLTLTDGTNYLAYAIFSALGSFIYGEFTYFFTANAFNVTFIYTDPTVYPVLGLISQIIYGLVGFIAPTSMLLVAGLIYLKIDYKEWVKFIWKFLVQLLIVGTLIVAAMAIISAIFM